MLQRITNAIYLLSRQDGAADENTTYNERRSDHKRKYTFQNVHKIPPLLFTDSTNN
ncbi:protein of unknown function [Lactobacillus delbrueckii subsp. delbrueckii]|uniref:Uncharacterized protein n=1 Tax=Lactobacillus delbrueckii subsp. delbrueckii TaxID=83684 RepID=A0AAU9R6M9_9LACO|nr:protein of unknown function [Lactobacillus delbrueckii subsp. delbrueckii]